MRLIRVVLLTAVLAVVVGCGGSEKRRERPRVQGHPGGLTLASRPTES